jgi:Domain of unknown function (DUF1707)
MTSEPSAGGTSPELRASHADRDRVVEILRVAAGDGRLTSDELDQRLEAALTARTYRELAELTADLPPSSSAVTAPRAAVRAQPKDLVRIECKGSSVRRVGGWVVPKAMEVSAIGGSVKLDFTEAVITEPVLRINANVRGGSLVLVTKPGIEVDADEVTLIGGSISSRIRQRARWNQPVMLRIEVSGQNHGGTIKARPPRRTFWQWLRRRQRPYHESITA